MFLTKSRWKIASKSSVMTLTRSTGDFFKNRQFPASFSSFSFFSIKFTLNNVQDKLCRWLDSNRSTNWATTTALRPETFCLNLTPILAAVMGLPMLMDPTRANRWSPTYSLWTLIGSFWVHCLPFLIFILSSHSKPMNNVSLAIFPTISSPDATISNFEQDSNELLCNGCQYYTQPKTQLPIG